MQEDVATHWQPDSSPLLSQNGAEAARLHSLGCSQNDNAALSGSAFRRAAQSVTGGTPDANSAAQDMSRALVPVHEDDSLQAAAPRDVQAVFNAAVQLGVREDIVSRAMQRFDNLRTRI